MADNLSLIPVRNAYSFRSSKFWCFNCPREFSKLRTDDSEIYCPACNSICEEIDPNNHPRSFQPFNFQQQANTSTSTSSRGCSTAQQQPTHTTTQNTQQQAPRRPQGTANQSQRIFMTFPPQIVIQRDIPIVTTNEEGLEGLDPMLLAMLGGLGGFGGFGGFGGLGGFGGFGGFNQETMNQIIEEFLRNDPNRYGPPPASQDAISKLREFKFDPSADCARGCKTCTVCQDDYVKEDPVIQMPCKHEFHKDCVLNWLKLHNTCPICRKGVESQQKA